MTAVFALLLLSFQAHGQEIKKDLVPMAVAVQDRTYFLSHELTLNAGFMPLDSFTHYTTVSGSYTYFFSDYLGWEVANVTYTQSHSTGLEEKLINEFGATPEALDFDVLNYFIATNVVWTPFYNKSLVFDKSIVYGETSFVGGYVVSKFEGDNFISGINLGAVFRFVLGEHWSMKLDVREYLYFSGTTKQHLNVALGLSYNFGASRKE